MKKIIYVLILSLVVVSGLVFSFAPFAYGSGANRETKNETKIVTKNATKNEVKPCPCPKPLTIAEKKARLEERKKWDASPDGIMVKKWEASPQGKKVQASHEKIKKYLKDFSDMEAVVTSVTFKRDGKSASIKWLIVRIDGEQYMMQFIPKDFEQLKSLKVNDKIIVKSHGAGKSPNHPYLILSADYIGRNKALFLRDFSKNKGC